MQPRQGQQNQTQNTNQNSNTSVIQEAIKYVYQSTNQLRETEHISQLESHTHSKYKKYELEEFVKRHK